LAAVHDAGGITWCRSADGAGVDHGALRDATEDPDLVLPLDGIAELFRAVDAMRHYVRWTSWIKTCR